MSDVPKKFTGEYYDIDYFATPKGKKFKRSNGSIAGWSYENPDGEWIGARSITEAWKEVFKPKNLLDVGAGRGTFIAYSHDLGIEAEGFDFSEWAISDEGRYHRCKKDWLKLHDATEPWPYEDNAFDLVIALDFYEHIYSEDISFVINEMYRVAKKWVFLQIACVNGGSGPGVHFEGYIFKKGESIPIELEGCSVAGHVTVRERDWWEERLYRDDWVIRRDLDQWFRSIVPSDVLTNWRTIIILSKLE